MISLKQCLLKLSIKTNYIVSDMYRALDSDTQLFKNEYENIIKKN